MSVDRLYVYAFVAAGRKDAPMPAGVKVVTLSGVDVAVSASAAPEPTVEALCAQHETVVRLACRFDAVLPVRFGAAVARTELTRVLRANRKTILAGLERVRCRAQMAVRVPAARPRRRRPPASSGTEYLRAKTRTASVPRSMQPLRDAVAGLFCDERVESDPRRGTVLLHLVARNDISEYLRRVKSAAGARTAVRAVITGPWPPFAFVPELW